MELKTMLNPNCLLVSFCMVLDVEPEEIVDHIGHDGQAVIWPNEPGCKKLRGIHIQELIDFCWDYDWYVVKIEAWPTLAPRRGVDPLPVGTGSWAASRLRSYLKNNDAVIVGMTPSGSEHAIAWEHKSQKYYDPNGWITESTSLIIREVYIIKSEWS